MNKLTPNSFQIPNAIVDDFIQLINGNELKIYLIIVRKTKGWNKKFDGISISQFTLFSGISSHNTIRKSLKKLIEINLIKEQKQDGKFSLFCIADPYQNMTMSKIEPLPKVDRPPLPKIDNTKIHYPKEEEEEEYLKYIKDFINKILNCSVSFEVFALEFYEYIYPKNKRSKQQKLWYGNTIKNKILEQDKQTLKNIHDFLEDQEIKNFNFEQEQKRKAQ